MKKASKILFGISAVILAAFAVKNNIDYSSYVKTVNSAPFDVAVSVNTLFFVLPAAVLAATALFLERKTRALAICAALFAAISVEELTRHITVNQFTASDSLLMAKPYIAAAVIFAVLLILSEMKSGSGRTLSAALFVISGAITAVFVVMCLNQIIDRRGLDNIMQLFTGLIIYSVIFLIPAAVCAFFAAKTKKRGKE